MRPGRQSVGVFRSAGAYLVDSTSMSESGGLVSNGWVSRQPVEGSSALRVGEAVLAGLEQSGEIASEDLPTVATSSKVASVELGFASEDAMLAAGVPMATVGLRDGHWRIGPMVNMGPGKGWSGHSNAPKIRHQGEWSAEELGAAVVEALDTAWNGRRRTALERGLKDQLAKIPEQYWGDVRLDVELELPG